MTNSNINLLDLPNEILLKILEYLLEIDSITLISSCPFVSKKFTWLCQDVRGKIILEKCMWWKKPSRFFTINSKIFFGTFHIISKYFLRIKGLENIKKIKYLDFENNQMYKLPENIKYFTKLTELKLSANKISELPRCIEKLSNLKILYVAENQLINLPDTIGNLKQLRELNLSRNNLTLLPSSIVNLTNLEILYLFHNKLIELPHSLENLKSLRVLNFSKNLISKLPKSLEKMESLQLLSWSKNKLEKSTLDSIRNMTGVLIFN